MNFYFHPQAEEELNQAIDYYENNQQMLGYDFAVEIYEAIQRAVDFPKAWPLIDKDIRRCLVNRFPYGILYSEEKGALYIIAVMNLHQRPDYWKERGE
jgi:plasmid stabilization system protein ParE